MLNQDDFVYKKFKQHIEEKGLSINKIEDDFVFISQGDFDLKISLENLQRNFERDKDEVYIEEFVSSILEGFEPLPEWIVAKKNVFPSLFPSSYEYDDFINYPITEKFNTVFIYSDDFKNTWLTYEQLTKWNISEKEFIETVYKNIQLELLNTSFQIDLIENIKLGFFETEHTTLKSSLLLSKNLKEKVINELGWPICAVLPVRDFCYLFSEKDFDFFSDRLGAIVVEEYKNSGYPITTEIIKISDDGIKAIGEYPVE